MHEFLGLKNEDIISGSENMLKKRKTEIYEEELKPMSLDKLNKEIDQAMEDSENDRVIKATELKAGVSVALKLVNGIIDRTIGLEKNPYIGPKEKLLEKRKQQYTIIMKKTILPFLTSLIIFSCQGNKDKVGYELNGVLKNIPDSSVIYISKSNKRIDSALVFNEKFKLTGKVSNPTNVYLMIKNSRDYKSFWLENSKIYFEAEQGNFKQAIITGSKTQQESDVLSERLKVVEREIDELEKSVDDSMTKFEMDSIRKQYKFLETKEIITYQKYVKEYSNSLVSSHILDIYATTWGKEKTKELFDLFSKENKESEYGKEIKRYIELNKEPKIGEQYIDFEMANQNDAIKKLSDIKRKAVLIEFWASWCGPCRQENPNLVKTYNQFKPKGFEIFAVSLDTDRNSWIKAIENDSLNWKHVSDLKGQGNEASLIYGFRKV